MNNIEKGFQAEAAPDQFEEQFKKREEFELLDSKFSAIDVKPKNNKFPDTPLMIAPGYGATSKMFHDTIQKFTEKERRVIAVDHGSHGGDINLKGSDPEFLKKYNPENMRRAFELIALLDQKNEEAKKRGEKGIESVDVLAHSEGAIDTLTAASMRPELFKNIVLMNPGGMIGKDNFLKLIKRFLIDEGNADTLRALRSETPPEEKKRHWRTVGEIVKSIAKNPARAIKEPLAIRASDITEMIKDTHDQGVGISIVAGVDDLVFPMERIQKEAEAENLDGFLSVKGMHNEIVLQPEKYVPAVEGLFEAMHAKQDKVRNNFESREAI